MLRPVTVVLALCLPFAALGQTANTATGRVIDNKGGDIGTVSVRGSAAGVVMRIQLKAGALPPGWHGAHLHAVGDCADTQGFQNSKGHVNHDQKKHGLLNGEGPDMGDLPNLYAAADGSVNAEVFSPFIKLAGDKGIKDADGTAFVIHTSEDDHMAQPIGNAGARIACAVLK